MPQDDHPQCPPGFQNTSLVYFTVGKSDLVCLVFLQKIRFGADILQNSTISFYRMSLSHLILVYVSGRWMASFFGNGDKNNSV